MWYKYYIFLFVHDCNCVLLTLFMLTENINLLCFPLRISAIMSHSQQLITNFHAKKFVAWNMDVADRYDASLCLNCACLLQCLHVAIIHCSHSCHLTCVHASSILWNNYSVLLHFLVSSIALNCGGQHLGLSTTHNFLWAMAPLLLRLCPWIMTEHGTPPDTQH